MYVVSIGVHLPHTPPPHPKIQSCARGPAGPTNVAKSSIDSGATHRNRPFRPISPFPWFFLGCKTVSAALEPHLLPPFSPGIPPKLGSKRRLLRGKRRLLGGKCGSKYPILPYIPVGSLREAALTNLFLPQKTKIAPRARRAQPKWPKVQLIVGQHLETHSFCHFARFHRFFWLAKQ